MNAYRKTVELPHNLGYIFSADHVDIAYKAKFKWGVAHNGVELWLMKWW